LIQLTSLLNSSNIHPPDGLAWVVFYIAFALAAVHCYIDRHTNWQRHAYAQACFM
jgi:hypothetical protein